MAYHHVESVVDQHLTQDMANYQLSRNLISVGYYVNVQTRSSIAHSHPYYEFILVRRGVCEYHSSGTRFLLHPDEMLLISPGTVHTMVCPKDSSSYERLILQVNADFMAQVLDACALGGRTPFEQAVLAFEKHVTQQRWQFEVYGFGSEYDSHSFGLYRSRVGPDTARNELFEHMESGMRH